MKTSKRELCGLKNRKTENIKHILLFVLVITGLFIRLIGFDWGGNSIYQPDEEKLVRSVICMVQERSWLSYDYYYPNQFLSKFQALAYHLYLVIWRPGGFAILQAYWIGRIVTAICGAVTILFVYTIGERLRPNVGMISAALFTVSPHMVDMSKQVTGDVGALFGSTITMLFALKYAKEPKNINILFMTLGCAIAMMEKWHGGGGTLLVALFILLYTNSFRDFCIRGLIAVSSFIGWIFIIAPNVILNIRESFIDGFIKIAVYNGEEGPGYLFLFKRYMEWGFLHIGGALYLIAVIGGLVIVFIRKDKRYCVLLLGVIKTLELCFLNRGFPRWGLELYLSEIICAAVFLGWLIENDNKIYNYVFGILISFILVESITAVACIELAALRKDQDIRAIQTQYCDNNGITIDNAISSYYSAFQPGGYRSEGLSERSKTDGSDVVGIEAGHLVKYTDKPYYIWTDMSEVKGDILSRMDDLIVWEKKYDYHDIFNNPIIDINHSWNDISLIMNNIKAYERMYNGAVFGTCHIKIYDISDVPMSVSGAE